MNVLTRSVKEAKGESTKQIKSGKSSGNLIDDKDKVSLASIDKMLEAGDLSSQGSSGSNSMAVSGYLHKKSGGKHDDKKKRGNWRVRYFSLPPKSTVLSYYKNEDAHEKGKEELGSLNVEGCTLFLKTVTTNGIYRFTISSTERELKLRADSEEIYKMWIGALRPLASVFRNLEEEAMGGGEDEEELCDDGELSDDERSFSLAGGLRGLMGAKSTKGGGGRDRGESSARGRAVSGAGVRGRGVTMASGGNLEGWLEKKQGGKEGKSTGLFSKKLGKWERRYFVVEEGTDELRYYDKPADYLAKHKELGSVSMKQSVVFQKDSPKDIAKGHYRFTIKDPTRELKLRADSFADVQAWVAALTASGRARLADSGAALDDDEEDEEEESTPRSEPAPAPPKLSAVSSSNPFDISDGGSGSSKTVGFKAAPNPFSGEDAADDRAPSSSRGSGAAGGGGGGGGSKPSGGRSAMSILANASGKH